MGGRVTGASVGDPSATVGVKVGLSDGVGVLGVFVGLKVRG